MAERKNSPCPFASSMKPKKRKSGTHEFNVEKARSLAATLKDSSFDKVCRALFNFASVSKLWPFL